MTQKKFAKNKHILIACGQINDAQQYANFLSSAGYQMSAIVGTGKDLTKNALEKSCDLIVANLDLPDGRSINALLEIAKINPKPAIIITEKKALEDVEESLKDHVMGFLVTPVAEAALVTTAYLVISRFAQFEHLKKENEKLKDQLATRKLLERVKGIVMVKYEFTEEDAYLKIRSLATSKRMTMAAVCEFLIKSLQPK